MEIEEKIKQQNEMYREKYKTRKLREWDVPIERPQVIFKYQWFDIAFNAPKIEEMAEAVYRLKEFAYFRNEPGNYDELSQTTQDVLLAARSEIEQTWQNYIQKCEKKEQILLEKEKEIEQVLNAPLDEKEKKFADLIGGSELWNRFQIQGLIKIPEGAAYKNNGNPTALDGVDLSELVSTVYERFTIFYLQNPPKNPISALAASLKNEVYAYFSDSLQGYKYEIKDGKLVKNFVQTEKPGRGIAGGISAETEKKKTEELLKKIVIPEKKKV
jgi:hypothetical protein